VSKCQVDGAFWFEALFDQRFHGFQQAHHLGFYILCAASPDVFVIDVAAEGRVFPLL
jgi:hypothetical protein